MLCAARGLTRHHGAAADPLPFGDGGDVDADGRLHRFGGAVGRQGHVGAIGADGSFDFSACYTHNYREFMGGFTDWVETVVESKSAPDYRKKVSAAESASMWQSLSFGANYKAAYCMAVCPAGEEVISPFLTDRKGYLQDTVKPLQKMKEAVYVVPGSDAEAHVIRRFPHKKVRRVRGSLHPRSIKGFLEGLPLVFRYTSYQTFPVGHSFYLYILCKSFLLP